MSYGPVSVDEVRSLHALRAFAEDQLTLLASVMARRTFEPGELIFLEGDPTVGLWFVARGHVKIIKQSSNGRIQALCLLNRDRCFGSCPLFHDGTYPATAQAENEVTLFILPTGPLRQLLHDQPRFASALLRIYNQRLALLARLSERLGAWTTADRINDCLVTYAIPTDGQYTVTLTHEKLASLAGTVREVVTRHLSALERDGILTVEPKQITIWQIAPLMRPCAARIHVASPRPR